MIITHHPFRAVGVIAGAALLGKRTDQITGDDLDALAARIVADATMAATATKDKPGYAWQLALAAMYPNSPAAHPGRAKMSAATIAARLTELFTPDGNPVGFCWLCGQQAGARWGKSLLPLAESGQILNTQPHGGQAVCRSCRVALWCLPYGSIHNGGTVTTVSSYGITGQAIVDEAVARNQQALTDRWSAWEGNADHVAGDIIRRAVIARPAQVEIHRWRNDNRTPQFQEWMITEPVADWLSERANDPAHEEGLRLLEAETGVHPITTLRVNPAAVGDPLESLIMDVGQVCRRVIEDGGTPDQVAPITRLAMSAAAACAR